MENILKVFNEYKKDEYIRPEVVASRTGMDIDDVYLWLINFSDAHLGTIDIFYSVVCPKCYNHIGEYKSRTQMPGVLHCNKCNDDISAVIQNAHLFFRKAC